MILELLIKHFLASNIGVASFSKIIVVKGAQDYKFTESGVHEKQVGVKPFIYMEEFTLGQKVLENGFRWGIGDGKSIIVYSDR